MVFFLLLLIFISVVIITVICSFFKGIFDFFRYGDTAIKRLYPEEVENTENHENIEEINAINDNIAMLETVIERRKIIACRLEKQLEDTINTNKQNSILSKLITLDKQTFRDIQTINKLKKQLEKLE